MTDLLNIQKIIKLIITNTNLMDRLLENHITSRHFVDAQGSRDSKIISKIFELALEYFQSSNGSLLTNDVFNARVAEANIKDEFKTDILALWMDIQKCQASNDDFHYLITDLKEQYSRKQLDAALSSLQKDLIESDIKTSVVNMMSALEGVYSQFDSLGIHRTKFDISTRAAAFEEEYLYRMQNKDKFKGITSGIPDIDQKTFGWQNGQLNVFLAPSAGGKSVQLLNCATHAHLFCRKNVIYFSFELDEWTCELRHLANILEIPFWKIKSLALTDNEFKDLVTKYKNMSTNNYFEYDVSVEDPTPEYIDSRIRDLTNTKGKPDIIFVDYIGNMTTRNSARGQKKWEKEGDAVEGLFKMAKRHHIPIITAQQINREAIRENRKNKADGKATAFFQDAASGDQRLIHYAHYVIGIEPDKENNIAVYHPVKMRDAYFDPCITLWDPDLYKIFALNQEDQMHWKLTKGLLKPADAEEMVRPKPVKAPLPERSYNLEEDHEDELDIPW
jgi:replicative DNA helicase